MKTREEKIMFMSLPRTSLRSILRLQPVSELGGELGIFSSSRAYIKRESPIFFLVPEPERQLGIFLNPRAYMEKTVRTITSHHSLRSVLQQQAEEKKRPELSQAPELI